MLVGFFSIRWPPHNHWHIGLAVYRCFLPDLTGFAVNDRPADGDRSQLYANYHIQAISTTHMINAHTDSVGMSKSQGGNILCFLSQFLRAAIAVGVSLYKPHSLEKIMEAEPDCAPEDSHIEPETSL